jgi:hypothetical protein
MASSLEASLRAAVETVERLGYRYALIGGIALAQWGVVRATYVVDLQVLAPGGDYAAARKALRTAFPQAARQEIGRSPFIVAVSIGDVIVDFLLALPGYEELIIERAIRRDLNGWSAWICSAQDLIIQKAVADREKDWLDVEALLTEQRGRIDLTYTSGWLAQFAEALERPEMMGSYNMLVARSSSTS